MSVQGAAVKGDVDYIVESYDIAKNTVKEEIDYKNNNVNVRGEMNKWDRNSYFDSENNMYFMSIDGGEFIINKPDLDTKENKEIYTYTPEGQSDTKIPLEARCSFCGYDGRYMIIIVWNEFAGGLVPDEDRLKEYIDMVRSSKSGVEFNITGIFDKAQIGTGDHEWINATPQ